MNEYLAMWKNYANFSDRTSIRGYWMAVLFNFLAGLVLGILAAVLGVFGTALSYIYSVAVIVPSLALTIRRLRDAGKAWTYIFISLIPLAGPIILLITLCKSSCPKPEEADRPLVA